MLKINVPIWKDKAVGIAIDGLNDSYTVELEILAARQKDGHRYYPNPFTITVAEIRAKKIRVEERKGNRPMLYIVPIIALHEVKPEEDNKESS